MAASQDECVAQFSRQQCCFDRTYSRLLAWAAYIGTQPLPPDTSTAPDKGVVQQRIAAERMPLGGYQYAPQVCPYLMEVPNVTQRVRDHLNAWNNEETETELATDIDAALAVVMPQYAAATVSDQDVADWCDQHGYPRPPGLVGIVTPPGVRRVA